MSIPATVRRPGVFVEFSVDDRTGISTFPVRVVACAIKSSAGTATAGTAVQVLDDDDADSKAGRGSQAALMLRAAFDEGRQKGNSPEIWLQAIDAPAGTAAAQTFTVTATTPIAGNVVFRIAGRTFVAGVAAGDTINTIALSMKAAVDASLATVPVASPVVALGVMTATAVHAGVHGNDIAYEVVSTPSGVTVVTAQSVAGVGTVDVTASLDALLDKDYQAIALGNHTSTDIADAVAHNTAAWLYTQQLYRHILIGTRDTLSNNNALAVAANHKTVLVLQCEGLPGLPGELAIRTAVSAWGKTNNQGQMPNVNCNGERINMPPPSPSLAYTSPEIESALAAGSTPFRPTSDGQAIEIVRLVTTKTVTNGAPDENELDLASSLTQAHMARQIIAQILKNHHQRTDSDEELLSVRDTVISVHETNAAAVPPVILEVEALKPEIRVTRSPVPQGRYLVDSPFKVAGPLGQIVVSLKQIVGAI